MAVILISAPRAHQVKQRSLTGTSSLAVAGTYTGTPTAIEARFAGGSWQTIVASPIGGTYSGTLTGLSAGQGAVDVRFANDLAVTASVTPVGIGDVYATYGQSNAIGQGTSNQTYFHATLTASKYLRSGTWAELADPIDVGNGGTYWTLLATHLMNYTGVPVAFVPGAISGTSITVLLPGANHLDTGTHYGALNSRVQAIGGVRAVLFHHGETDAINGMSQATYKGHLATLADAIAADMGCPLIPCRQQNSSGIADAAENVIRAAVDEAVAEHANIYAGPNLAGLASDDAYHLKSDSNLIAAAALWRVALIQSLFGVFWMAFTQFCCRFGGSNLNAGSLIGDTTQPGTSASFTYASGSWVASTGVFTVASGNPSSDGVAVGDFASVYADGSTVTGFVGRVTARDTTTITVSLTAKSGTAPADGTNTRTLKIGGAWQGPNGAAMFPFDFVEAALTNVAAYTPRVNLKNDATYSITAAMTHADIGPIRFQGYTTSYGDGGRATIDGGTSGASYVLLTVSATNIDLVDLIFQNNGATGSAAGVAISGTDWFVTRSVLNSVRGHGWNISASGMHVESEAYACNQSNTANTNGFSHFAVAIKVIRCIAHDNSGSNAAGFSTNAGVFYEDCISDTNGGAGFVSGSTTVSTYSGCDAYNNGGSGIQLSNSSAASSYIENCNLVKNAAWGINGSGAGARSGEIVNCAFGSGTQANTSGTTTGLKSMVESGSVTYATDVTPWVAPTTGDFRLNLAAAKSAGRGTFTQTAASYTGTIGYPDIGAGDFLAAWAAAADVESGVDRGDGTLGTLTLPAVGNVVSGVQFGGGGTQFTGTYVVTAAGSVLSTVTFGAGGGTSGTYVVVATANVRSGTTFGAASALTGTLSVPTAANVLNGVAVDAGTGTYVVVLAANVLAGITFGPSSSLTGTLDYTIAGGSGVPVLRTFIELHRGDEYKSSEGTAILVTKEAGENWPTTLDSVHFYAEPTAEAIANGHATALQILNDVACGIIEDTGDDQSLYLELTKAQTDDLSSLAGSNEYEFQFVANKADYPATIRGGTLTVRQTLRTLA